MKRVGGVSKKNGLRKTRPRGLRRASSAPLSPCATTPAISASSSSTSRLVQSDETRSRSLHTSNNGSSPVPSSSTTSLTSASEENQNGDSDRQCDGPTGRNDRAHGLFRSSFFLQDDDVDTQLAQASCDESQALRPGSFAVRGDGRAERRSRDIIPPDSDLETHLSQPQQRDDVTSQETPRVVEAELVLPPNDDLEAQMDHLREMNSHLRELLLNRLGPAHYAQQQQLYEEAVLPEATYVDGELVPPQDNNLEAQVERHRDMNSYPGQLLLNWRGPANQQSQLVSVTAIPHTEASIFDEEQQDPSVNEGYPMHSSLQIKRMRKPWVVFLSILFVLLVGVVTVAVTMSQADNSNPSSPKAEPELPTPNPTQESPMPTPGPSMPQAESSSPSSSKDQPELPSQYPTQETPMPTPGPSMPQVVSSSPSPSKDQPELPTPYPTQESPMPTPGPSMPQTVSSSPSSSKNQPELPTQYPTQGTPMPTPGPSMPQAESSSPSSSKAQAGSPTPYPTQETPMPTPGPFMPLNALWKQIGQDILGKGKDDFAAWSVSMSHDGNIVVMGVPECDMFDCHETSPPILLPSGPGYVLVYRFDESSQSWAQMGQELVGVEKGDMFGDSVSLNHEGNILAIGAHLHWNDGAGESAGQVLVYTYNNVTSLWEQLGDAIDGEVSGGHFGQSVSLSDNGLRLAVGAYNETINGNNTGSVRLFQFETDTQSWEQLGEALFGEANDDRFGWSVSLSGSGTIVGVGAYENDWGGLKNSGQVSVYQYIPASSTWSLMGQKLHGHQLWDGFGYSVSLDGTGFVLAVGSRKSKEVGKNGGSVNVFIYDDNRKIWTRQGRTLLAKAAGDRFGHSVSISRNGNVLAAGAVMSDSNGIKSGQARIFEYDESNAVGWIQVGEDIDGDATYARTGWSVSVSANGTLVVIGSRNSGGSFNRSGVAKVYTINTPAIRS